MENKKEEITFYEELIKDNPDFIQALIVLAELYTHNGLYEKGLKIDKRLSEIKPYDPIVHYNLACSFSLTGNLDDSLRALKKAVLLGYGDFEYILEDEDLSNLRRTDDFKTLFSKLERVR
ncbi:MAG: hypothetical protein GF375_03255 [Candidatus Omnitrophica bacterium]|nr:hypothetical protein [Candidatus Omnitrophota bacterium]MBD3269100.1 hypothetical protein [Candidatus Omnitrophota bacterium]